MTLTWRPSHDHNSVPRILHLVTSYRLYEWGCRVACQRKMCGLKRNMRAWGLLRNQNGGLVWRLGSEISFFACSVRWRGRRRRGIFRTRGIFKGFYLSVGTPPCGIFSNAFERMSLASCRARRRSDNIHRGTFLSSGKWNHGLYYLQKEKWDKLWKALFCDEVSWYKLPASVSHQRSRRICSLPMQNACSPRESISLDRKGTAEIS